MCAAGRWLPDFFCFIFGLLQTNELVPVNDKGKKIVDLKEGFGSYKWKDGKRYAGYHVHDKKEGFGIYYWPITDRVFIGFWKDGKQHGTGIIKGTDGCKLIGEWKNGIRIK